MILGNVGFLMLEHYNQPEWLTRLLETANIIFIIFYTIEMVLKIFAFGIVPYISNAYNALDALIVFIRFIPFLIYSFEIFLT